MEKQDKFYGDPSILIFVSVPAKNSQEAIRQLMILAAQYRLRIEVIDKKPDPEMPKSLFHAIMVKPDYKINSAEKLVIASNAVTSFQSAFSMTVFKQNMPSNMRKKHGI